MEMMAMKIFKQNLLDTGDALELAKKTMIQQQIQKLKISRERVRQLEKKAQGAFLGRMRRGISMKKIKKNGNRSF